MCGRTTCPTHSALWVLQTIPQQDAAPSSLVGARPRSGPTCGAFLFNGDDLPVASGSYTSLDLADLAGQRRSLSGVSRFRYFTTDSHGRRTRAAR